MIIKPKFLAMKQIVQIVPFSASKIYKLIKIGEFPKQYKVGGSSLWKYDEVMDYCKKLEEDMKNE